MAGDLELHQTFDLAVELRPEGPLLEPEPRQLPIQIRSFDAARRPVATVVVVPESEREVPAIDLLGPIESQLDRRVAVRDIDLQELEQGAERHEGHDCRDADAHHPQAADETGLHGT